MNPMVNSVDWGALGCHPGGCFLNMSAEDLLVCFNLNCIVDLFHEANTPVKIQVAKVNFLRESGDRSNDEVSTPDCSR